MNYGTFTVRLLLLFLILSGSCASTLQADQLNVLLIMVDDLRDYGGAFTRDIVKTPNLDRLRARGTTFERAYVQYPACNPSRSSMMVGLRAEQTGIVGIDISSRQSQLLALSLGDPAVMLFRSAQLIDELCVQLSACLVLFAVMDYGFRFWRHELAV